MADHLEDSIFEKIKSILPKTHPNDDDVLISLDSSFPRTLKCGKTVSFLPLQIQKTNYEENDAALILTDGAVSEWLFAVNSGKSSIDPNRFVVIPPSIPDLSYLNTQKSDKECIFVTNDFADTLPAVQQIAFESFCNNSHLELLLLDYRDHFYERVRIELENRRPSRVILLSMNPSAVSFMTGICQAYGLCLAYNPTKFMSPLRAINSGDYSYWSSLFSPLKVSRVQDWVRGLRFSNAESNQSNCSCGNISQGMHIRKIIEQRFGFDDAYNLNPAFSPISDYSTVSNYHIRRSQRFCYPEMNLGIYFKEGIGDDISFYFREAESAFLQQNDSDLDPVISSIYLYYSTFLPVKVQRAAVVNRIMNLGDSYFSRIIGSLKEHYLKKSRDLKYGACHRIFQIWISSIRSIQSVDKWKKTIEAFVDVFEMERPHVENNLLIPVLRLQLSILDKNASFSDVRADILDLYNSNKSFSDICAGISIFKDSSERWKWLELDIQQRRLSQEGFCRLLFSVFESDPCCLRKWNDLFQDKLDYLSGGITKIAFQQIGPENTLKLYDQSSLDGQRNSVFLNCLLDWDTHKNQNTVSHNLIRLSSQEPILRQEAITSVNEETNSDSKIQNTFSLWALGFRKEAQNSLSIQDLCFDDFSKPYFCFLWVFLKAMFFPESQCREVVVQFCNHNRSLFVPSANILAWNQWFLMAMILKKWGYVEASDFWFRAAENRDDLYDLKKIWLKQLSVFEDYKEVRSLPEVLEYKSYLSG